MRDVRVVPRVPGRALAALAAVVAVFGVQLAAAGPAAAASEWELQDTGPDAVTAAFYGVDCPTTNACYAVGDGVIVATSDAGRSWQRQSVPAAFTNPTGRVHGVSCTTQLVCVAVGYPGPRALTTGDGGKTWVERSTGLSSGLIGVSCPAAAVCYAVGDGGKIIKSTNAGASWTTQPSGTTSNLFGVSCASAATCVAVGLGGTVATSDGGLTWALQSSGTTSHLMSVDCASAATCVAVGLGGVVMTSVNGGKSWTQQVSPTGLDLEGVSCPTANHCYVVGTAGWVMESLDAGKTWAGTPYNGGNGDTLRAISCADNANCWAVGTNSNGKIITNSKAAQTAPPALPRIEVPSNDCEVAPATTVIDGYFGSLYARSKVKSEAGETWVCTRLQEEGEQEIVGGKFVVADATSIAAADDEYGECSTAAGNLVPGGHPVTSGAIGQPGDAHYTPYLLDGYANSVGDAWVCLRAGLGVRLKFNGAAPAFQQDDPQDPAAVSPPRVPWPVGKASAACETQVGGAVGRHVNATIAGARVWVSSRTEGSKAELCFRAQGSESAGGRVTVDTSGSPGVMPVIQPAFDTIGCTRTELSEEPRQLYVRRSETGANPASVCVSLGGSTVRLTVGYTGTPTAPEVVDWEIDND